MIRRKYHPEIPAHILWLEAALERPQDLRERADWYRRMAQIGHPDHTKSRLTFAEYLERQAADIEHAQNHAGGG